MNYKDINDKWKSFLFENTFKEDKIIDPDKVRKKKKRKPEKKHKEDGKEIITNEWEEFQQEQEMDEWSLPPYVGSEDPKSAGYNDAVDSVEEEQLEETSGVGGITGYAANAFADVPFKRKKARKQWS